MKKTLLLIAYIICALACKKSIPVKIKAGTDKTKVHTQNHYYEKGIALQAKNDSAFYYFNKAATTAKDSLTIAKSYNRMGALQSEAGDYFGSQESLLSSLRFLDEDNPDHFSCFASDYNELAVTSYALKNYDDALRYYDASARYSDDDRNKRIIANNKALIYQDKGNYSEAIKIYNTIIDKSKETQKEYARILTNLAFAKWLQNPKYNAKNELLRGLRIRQFEKDDWGLNSSYAHLADFYSKTNTTLALSYATSRYRMSIQLASTDDQLEALQKLIKLSPPTETKQYFTVYQKLSDSLQTARNAAKNQFALVRYVAEKNKVEYLQFQKDLAVKKYQIAIREFLLMGISFIFVGLAVFAFIWFNKRQQKLKLEAKNALRDSQLKTSKKVHDVVANGLYRVMTEIGNQRSVNRELILDKIEDLYEKSRDISYEKSITEDTDFSKVFSELLKSFATEHTKVIIAGNNAKLWDRVSETVGYEIEQVVQELMVNMRKHSQASHVVLKFERTEYQINIYYTDNGIGIHGNPQENNGLRNTGNRMNTIDGAITFDTTAEKGLKIQISFPVS